LRPLPPDVPATAWLANFRQPFRLKTAAQKGFNKANSGLRYAVTRTVDAAPGNFSVQFVSRFVCSQRN
jgi:hypothetical protein